MVVVVRCVRHGLGELSRSALNSLMRVIICKRYKIFGVYYFVSEILLWLETLFRLIFSVSASVILQFWSISECLDITNNVVSY